MSSPVAGWYPDPEGGSGMRYWDGSSWTDHRHDPAEQAAPETPLAVSSGAPVYMPAPTTSTGSDATTMLVLSILSVLCCSILAPFSLYMSMKAKREARDAGREADGQVQAAFIISIIGIIFMVIGIGYLVLSVMLGIGGTFSGSNY